MSKITNDGLTRSGTGCFIAVPYGNSGRQMVKDTPKCYGKDDMTTNTYTTIH